MLTVVAYALAIALAFFIIAIGARFVIAPKVAAAGYGVPVPSMGDGYLAVKGVRDICFGITGLALIAFTNASAVGWFMLGVAIVPLADTWIVLRHGGTKTIAFGVHFATAVIVIASAILLFAA